MKIKISGADRKLVYVDMDNVLVDFKAGLAKLDEGIKREYEGRLDEVPGFFHDLPPITGALEAYRLLNRDFQTYILSTAPWDNPSAWVDKLLWVKRHLGPEARKKLILSHNKHLNYGHYLIDDRPNNGAAQFPGEWIHFGTADFPDWKAVLTYLGIR